jgi:hypothetical protein
MCDSAPLQHSQWGMSRLIKRRDSNISSSLAKILLYEFGLWLAHFGYVLHGLRMHTSTLLTHCHLYDSTYLDKAIRKTSLSNLHSFDAMIPTYNNYRTAEVKLFLYWVCGKIDLLKKSSGLYLDIEIIQGDRLEEHKAVVLSWGLSEQTTHLLVDIIV